MKHLVISVAMLMLLSATPVAAKAPKIVTTIQPLHSLVSGVMNGIGAPELLLKGNESPHSFSLKPSTMKLLSNADAIFWIGPSIESFLEKALDAIDGGPRVITLVKTDDLKLYDAREGGIWGKGEDAHGHGHGHGHGHSDHDAHIWLDPKNAQVIVDAVADTLSDLDSVNAKRYRQNANDLKRRLETLLQETKRDLAAVRQAPYIVFHDAYQYFERRFGTKAMGAISVHPERTPGAKRLYEIRTRIVKSNIRCIFKEPQFTTKAAERIAEGTSAKVKELDPLGAGLSPGPDSYFKLIKGITSSIKNCAAVK